MGHQALVPTPGIDTRSPDAQSVAAAGEWSAAPVGRATAIGGGTRLYRHANAETVSALLLPFSVC